MSQADVDFLGLAVDAAAGTAILRVAARHCGPYGYLYGGTGIAVCAAAAEAITARPLVWITTQYVSNAFTGEHIDIDVVESVRGAATSQAQVRGVVGDRLVFTATTAHSDRDPGETHTWGDMPAVSAPEASDAMPIPDEPAAGSSFVDTVERLVPPESRTSAADGRKFVWTRVPAWPIGSGASQGYVADMVPMGVSTILGREMGGTSLDNTIRVVHDEPVDDWVLLDIEAEGFRRGIGHGRVRLWRRDGTLIGIGSQSAIIRTSHHQRRGRTRARSGGSAP